MSDSPADISAEDGAAHRPTRRAILGGIGAGLATGGSRILHAAAPSATAPASSSTSSAPMKGDQRLSLQRLQLWETLRYGMFIHFGMSTFSGDEQDAGQSPPSTYAPDKLDVDQWVSVARDAGMKYAVLTAKHHAGHCLWPSRHTAYSVASSANTTDVVRNFVESCRKRGVLPGLYYSSLDHHHRFGSLSPMIDKSLGATGEPEFRAIERRVRERPDIPLPAFVSSTYQDFQTAQIEELLGVYGPIMEIWIDIPNVLGRGYRTYLYQRMADLHPDAVTMMNNGVGDGTEYSIPFAWPSDLIAMEQELPPAEGHQKWREIDNRLVYMPGEMCTSITEHWFHVDDEEPRALDILLTEFTACRERGVNYLLNVAPDRHGVIPQSRIAALRELRRAAAI